MGGWVNAGMAAYSIYSGERERSTAKKQERRQLEATKKNAALDMNEEARAIADRDRVRRRRGVLSNIHAGNNAETPVVSKRKALAQPYETLG